MQAIAIKFANRKSSFAAEVNERVERYFAERGLSDKANLAMVLKTVVLLGITFGSYAASRGFRDYTQTPAFWLWLVGMGLVVYVRDFIEANLDFGISFVEREVGVSSVITVSMLLAIPIGLAFSLVSVAARVVMNEHAPPEAQGRIFAVQMALGDLLSLLPLLLVGVVADVVGVRATLLASALSAIAVAAYLTFSRRFGPPEEPPSEWEPAPETA